MAVWKRTRKNRKNRKGLSNKNILNTRLQACSSGSEKTTGFYRDGYCSTGPTDTGTHVVCAKMDNNFLENLLGAFNIFAYFKNGRNGKNSKNSKN